MRVVPRFPGARKPKAVKRLPAAAGRTLTGAEHNPLAHGMNLKNTIQTSGQLHQRLGLSCERLDEVLEAYPMRIPPHVEARIQAEGGKGPVSRQYLPTPMELDDAVGLTDPLAERELEIVPNLIKKYPDRVLLLLTNQCAAYCRFCTRKRRVGQPMPAPAGWLETALDAIASMPQVRDVLLSGGDPLLLSDRKLAAVLDRLSEIRQVEIVRIGTRIPMVMPERITDALVGLLKRFQPLYLMVHVNHPDELDPGVREACSMLADAGVPLLAQTVLLRNVNDSTEVLQELFRELLRLRIRPYQLMQGDLTAGTDHFRTDLASGLEIMAELQGHTSGLAIPAFVLDLPGGGGKVQLSPTVIVEETSAQTTFRNYLGQLFSYPNSRRNVSSSRACHSRPGLVTDVLKSEFSPGIQVLATSSGTLNHPSRRC